VKATQVGDIVTNSKEDTDDGDIAWATEEGQTSEGAKPKGATGTKQGRNGEGRSKTSRGRESLKTSHSWRRQLQCWSLSPLHASKGTKTSRKSHLERHQRFASVSIEASARELKTLNARPTA
jgi:hypothetical protein